MNQLEWQRKSCEVFVSGIPNNSPLSEIELKKEIRNILREWGELRYSILNSFNLDENFSGKALEAFALTLVSTEPINWLKHTKNHSKREKKYPFFQIHFEEFFCGSINIVEFLFVY